MERKHNKSLTNTAKTLRNNMTDEERHLWYDFLRNYPVKFIRQKILGHYIVDFYAPQLKLVIELDGSQHYEAAGLSYDQERSDFLKNYDIRVVRIPNSAIHDNFSGVCEYIDSLVRQMKG